MTWLLWRTAGSGQRSISCSVRSSSWYARRARCILRADGRRQGTARRPGLGRGSQAPGGGGVPGTHLRAQVTASFLSISAIS